MEHGPHHHGGGGGGAPPKIFGGPPHRQEGGEIHAPCYLKKKGGVVCVTRTTIVETAQVGGA